MMILLPLAVFASVGATDKFAVDTWEIGTHKKPAKDAGYHLTVFAPVSSSSGSAPTLLFVTGFGASVEASAYSELLSGVASHGFVVVGADVKDGIDPVPNYVKLGQLLSTTTGILVE